MSGLSMRLVSLLALGVILLSVVGSGVTLVQTIDAVSALGLLVVGGAVWITVIIGIRRGRSTQTSYW